LYASEASQPSADTEFVVPEAPTVDDAMQRFQFGVFSASEKSRVYKVFHRFAGAEWVLNKDSLDMVAGHLGYSLASEDVMELMANDVNEESSFTRPDELMNFLRALNSVQLELLEAAFDKQVLKEGTAFRSELISIDGLALVMKDLHFVLMRDNMEELLQRAGIAGKPAVSIDDAARVLAAYRECEGFTNTELQKARESFDKVAVKDVISMENLSNTLLEFCDPEEHSSMASMKDFMKHLNELFEAAGDAMATVAPVSFHEFLVWARLLRNAQLMEISESA